MHLRNMEARPTDTALTELDDAIANGGYIEQFQALFVHRVGLFRARLFLQFVVVAQAALLQQVVHYFTTVATEVLACMYAVFFFAPVPTVITRDSGQLLDLHDAKTG